MVTGIDFLLADQNWPFLAAMVMTLGISAVQVLSLVLGLGLSEMLDNLAPDFDADIDADIDADLDADVDGDADAGGVETSQSGIFAQAFGWLNVGRVPLLILLVCFLGLFTLIGYFAQLGVASVFGLMPAIIAGPLALAVALPATRVSSRLLAHIVPKEETYAVSDEQLIGLVAKITLGPVDRQTPGKAKLNDQHGNIHFVRVQAAKPDSVHEIGDQVLLVNVSDALFEVIAAPSHLKPDTPI